LKKIFEKYTKFIDNNRGISGILPPYFLRSLTMMKIVSALLLAAMFIGCSDAAKTEEAAAPVAEEVAAPAAEEAAAPVAEEAAVVEEANATDAAATPAQ
jgi:hypothetical protein